MGTVGYTHSRLVLTERLKKSFETGSATPQQIANTAEFLERAARYRGTEYDVIRNMITIEVARDASQPANRRQNVPKKEADSVEEIINNMEFAMAKADIPGPKEYSEALRQGKLPEIPSSARVLGEVIKYKARTNYAEYHALIEGLNESMDLALPLHMEVKMDVCRGHREKSYKGKSV